MNKRYDILKCDLCNLMVEVLHDGAGNVLCCNQPMTKLSENTVDASNEKHVPVLEKIADGYKVTVGAELHPMLDKHYIEWIELRTEDGSSLRKYLNPGDDPRAEFKTNKKAIDAREFCNLHGLWKS